MKVYLVGGAVRDALLGLPVHEKDWVVVGATPQWMLEQGYRQVGRDFPVFLHPTTHEEYALARVERKMGAGYLGFVCAFDSKVSLEEDLVRRDLTINAMAQDGHGNLIDPYHGQDDLRAKLLRHVSPAFVEDPVRVLRVARFAARYHHLGFHVADETRMLMSEMVRRGELAHLVPERIWQEWQRSLEERSPEQFLITLEACGALQVVLPEIAPCSLQGIDSSVARFAALMPEALGVDGVKRLCRRFRIPKAYGQVAVLKVRFYSTLCALLDLDAEAVVGCLEQTDAFRRRDLFEQLLMACGDDTAAMLWARVLDECVQTSVKPLIEQGYQGGAIQLALHQCRVSRVETLLASWKHHER